MATVKSARLRGIRGPRTNTEAQACRDVASLLGVVGVPRPIGLMPFTVAWLMLAGCARIAPDDAGQVDEQVGAASMVIIERGSDCDQCRVTLDSVFVLGAITDSFSLGDAATLVVVGDDCVVGPTSQDGELLIYDDCQGEPQPLGRPGQGPGELGSIRALTTWRGDSVLAMGYGRATVLSLATGAGRTFHFDPAVQGFRIVVLPDDSLIVVASDHPNQPQFTSLQFDGSRGPTFGLPATTVGMDAHARSRIMGPSPVPHHFWAGASAYRHRLESWTARGELQRVIDRTPTWFPPYDSVSLRRFWAASASTSQPLPSVRAIQETADGLLWVAGAVAATTWKPDVQVAENRRTATGERVVMMRSRLEHYDGVLEVLDALTGDLIISVRTGDLWGGFANDTLIYSRRESSAGVPQLVVYGLRLIR